MAAGHLRVVGVLLVALALEGPAAATAPQGSKANITILVDGKPVRTDVPALTHAGRIMVFLRFVSEALGANVEWDEVARTVVVTPRGRPLCELACPEKDVVLPGLWLPLRLGPAFTFPGGVEILGGYHGPEEGRWAASWDTVLVGIKDHTAGGRRFLVALDRNLKQKWRRELSPIAPPVIAVVPERPGAREVGLRRRLVGVAQLDNDRVVGFRLDNGATLWTWNRCDHPELADDKCGQPHPDDLGSHQVRAAGGIVFFYLDSGPGSLVAVDAGTGEMLWKVDARDVPAEVKAAYPGAPYGWGIHWQFFLAGEDGQGPVVAVVNSGSDPDSLLILEGRTGKILWHRKWTGWGRHMIDGRRGLLLTWVKAYDLDYGRDPFLPQNALVAFDLRTGQERWRYVTPASEPRSFAVSPGGRVFLGERYRNSAGNVVWRLVALEAGSGKAVWQRDLPGEFSRAFYADERQVLYRLFAGEVRAASAADGRALQVGANPGTNPNLVVEANRIYRFEERRVQSFLGSPPAVTRILVAGREVKADVPPVVVEGRVFVPARFVSEALGARVRWDERNRTLTITRPGR